MFIRGHASKLDDTFPVAKACEDALARLKKKAPNTPALGSKTPKSMLKINAQLSNQTPVILSNTPRSSNDRSSVYTPRVALSPLKSNAVVTPNQSASISGSINRAAASRRLEMSPVDYSSPTRDLPNYVADGISPHSRISSSTKRKKLDWLTDLSRKMSPSPQSKMRKIK